MEPDMNIVNKSSINEKDDNELVIQPVLDESKLPLTKIISMIVNLGKEDSVKKARILDQSKAVKKLLDKKDYTAQDKNNLRQLFYDNFTDEDYELEESMYGSMLANLQKDPSYANVKKSTVSKDARELALFAVVDQKKRLLQSYLNANTDIKSKVSKAYATVLNLSDKKSKVVSEKDCPLKSQIETILKNVKNPFLAKENFDAILDPEGKYENDSKNKQNLIEYLKEKKKEKFKGAFDTVNKVNENIFEINQKLALNNNKWGRIGHEKKIENLNDANPQDWNNLPGDNFDINFHIANFMNHCIESINKDKVLNPSVLLELSNIIICIYNRLTNLEGISATVSHGVQALTTLRIEEAKMGDKGKNVLNKRLILDNFLAKSNKKFYSAEDWKKLSTVEKIKQRFAFKDYSLNPPVKQWNELSIQEKKDFLALKADYINKRIPELKDMLKENNIVALRWYDNLKYYYNKDSRGYLVDIDSELLKDFKMPDDVIKMKEELDKVWEKASREGSIVNHFYFKGSRFNSEGLSANFFVKKNFNKIKKVLEHRKNKNNKKINFSIADIDDGNSNKNKNKNKNDRKNNNNKNKKNNTGNNKKNNSGNKNKNRKNNNNKNNNKKSNQRTGQYWSADKSNSWSKVGKANNKPSDNKDVVNNNNNVKNENPFQNF